MTMKRDQVRVICLITLLLLSLGYLGICDASVASVSGSQPVYFIARTETGKPVDNPNDGFHITAAPPSQIEAQRYKGPDRWLSASPSSMGFNQDALEATITKIGQMTGIYSLLIVRNRYMVVERYFREGHRFKPHNLKSASKAVLSALIGIAIDEGRFGLDQPIAELLPPAKHLNDPRKAGITIRHLLTMTSGLKPTSYQSYNKWISEGDWVQTALDQPLVIDPGTSYQYSTGNSHVLSAILTFASGMSTKEYAIRKLFDPMNITVQGWDTDPNGIFQGGNNLSLIPRDMVKFGQLYLDGGKFGHNQIIPKWWVDLSTSAEQFGANEIYGAYGHLWFVRPGGRDAFVAVGFGGQYIYVSPEYNCVLVVTSTLESKGRPWEEQLFGLINNGIIGSIDTGQQELLLATELNGSSDEDKPATTATESNQSRTPYVEVSAQPIGQTVRNVILRKDSSRKSKRLGLVPSSSKINILETKGRWHRVQYGAKEGWLHGAYVKIITTRQTDISSGPAKKLTDEGIQQSEIRLNIPAASRNVATETHEGRVLTRLNLRKGASQTDSIIIILEPGTKIEIEEQVGSWLRVRAGRRKGWVSADFVRIIPSEAITIARPQPEATPSVRPLTSQKQEQKPAITSARPLQAKEDYIELQALVERLRSRLHASDQTQHQFADELASTREQTGALQKALTESQAARENLGTELANVQTTLQSLQTDRQDLISKLAKFQKNLEDQRQTNARSETTRKELTSELGEMRTTVVALGEALNSEQAAKDNLKTALSTLRQDFETRQKAAARSEIARKAVLSELDGERTRIGALNETLKSMQAARDNLKTELSSLRKDLKTQQKVSSRSATQSKIIREALTSELASAHAKIDSLSKALLDSRTTRKSNTAKIENLLLELQQQRKSTANLESAQKTLKVDLATVHKQISVLKTASEASPKTVAKSTATKPEIAVTATKLEDQEIDKTVDTEIIESFLRSWVEAWEQRDVKAYLSHYSNAFQPPGGISLKLWRKQRQQRLLKPAFIEIEIRNIQKKTTGALRAQVTFNQMYRSNTYSDETAKTLDLQWKNEGWEILAERSKAR